MTSTTAHSRAISGVATLAAILLVLATVPSIAAAAEPSAAPKPRYMAFTSCREGSQFTSEGDWTAVQEGTYPFGAGTESTCMQAGGALRLRDEGAMDDTPESGPAYMFQGPGVIEAGVIHVTLISPGGQAFIAIPKAAGPPQYLVFCTELCTTLHSTEVSVPAGTYEMLAQAQCTAPSGQSTCTRTGVNAELNITSSTMLIRNEATPEATGIAGPLTESPVSGTANVTFEAHDKNGTGVYRVSVLIDGEQIYSATPNLNEGRCLPTGTYDGAFLFHFSRPCPLETPVRIELPTASFTDGPHLVEVSVEDAAGNHSTIFDKTLQFLNHPGSATPPASTPAVGSLAPPASTPAIPLAPAPERGPCNGSPCDEAANLTREANEPLTFTTTLSKSRETLGGHLRDHAGVPIKNAQVQLLEQPQAAGASMTHVATVTTSADGSWRITVPPGPSRLLRVAYYSHLLDATPAAALAFREQVKATASIRAPRRVRVGQEFTFTGQLLGGYIPPGGEAVQLEIFFGRRWRTIEVLHTNPRGVWSYSYAFTVEGGAAYKFRAVPVPNGTYPFTSGTSRSLSVTVER
jgi:hypothetical protein